MRRSGSRTRPRQPLAPVVAGKAARPARPILRLDCLRAPRPARARTNRHPFRRLPPPLHSLGRLPGMGHHRQPRHRRHRHDIPRPPRLFRLLLPRRPRPMAPLVGAPKILQHTRPHDPPVLQRRRRTRQLPGTPRSNILRQHQHPRPNRSQPRLPLFQRLLRSPGRQRPRLGIQRLIHGRPLRIPRRVEPLQPRP